MKNGYGSYLIREILIMKSLECFGSRKTNIDNRT